MSQSTLSVTVNSQTVEVPNTVSTATEFLCETGFETEGPRQYELYRIDNNTEVGPINGMLVFDEDDEFVVVPQTTTGG